MGTPDIQEQIDELSESIDDLESSPSGVLSYLTELTNEAYENVWWKTERDFDSRAEELNDQIVEASGYLRILKNGIKFHRH